MCVVLSYIWEHIWDITQTLLWGYAILYAIKAWEWSQTQFKSHSKIEYNKLKYEINKWLLEDYESPLFQRLHREWHPDFQDNPEHIKRYQDDMVTALHELQTNLAEHAGIELSDKTPIESIINDRKS